MAYISLLTTESEYTTLALSRRDVIPLTELLKEQKEVVLSEESAPTIYYTIFEDNTRCIDLVEIPCTRP